MYMFALGCLSVFLLIRLKRWFNKEIIISAKHWGDPPEENPDFNPELYDIYLAGPMKGKEGGNKQLFLAIGQELQNMGFSVWNPALQNDADMTFTHCIKNDLMAVIEECKAMVLLPGWRKSLGANAEVLTAYLCGKLIQELALDDNGKIIGCGKLDVQFVLPFAPEHKKFRSQAEMMIPEKDVFKNVSKEKDNK